MAEGKQTDGRGDAIAVDDRKHVDRRRGDAVRWSGGCRPFVEWRLCPVAVWMLWMLSDGRGSAANDTKAAHAGLDPRPQVALAQARPKTAFSAPCAASRHSSRCPGKRAARGCQRRCVNETRCNNSPWRPASDRVRGAYRCGSPNGHSTRLQRAPSCWLSASMKRMRRGRNGSAAGVGSAVARRLWLKRPFLRGLPRRSSFGHGHRARCPPGDPRRPIRVRRALPGFQPHDVCAFRRPDGRS